MATLTMEQDTDMKRFIEDRKQRYYDNDKAAVFATSLPLSNNGVEDRRSQLRDERHRDYQRYLERFGQQYQKAGDEHIENPFLPPPGAMPKSPAKREVQQQRMDRKYDQKYDQILQETEQSPANSQQSSANSKQSSTKQAVYYRMDSPERGLPLGNYDLVKEKLSQERHQDYKNYLKKKHQDESERNRTRYSPSRPQVPPQPRPGDIDYSQMKQELADERKRDYQDYLQQQEHMYVRAQQENGIPVLDRTPREEISYVTSKPPPGPGAYRQRDERESEKYRPHADELPPPGPSDFPKGHHYNSDEYEKYRKDLQQKQHAEYQDFLQKKQMSDPPRFGRNTPPVVGPYSGIFAGLGQYDLDKQRLKKERQSEYSNYLDKTYAEKGRPYGRPTWAKDIDDSEQYPARPYSYEHRSNPETKPRDHLPPIEGQGQGDRRPPSYEDMLAKNRQKEADRRRYDPGFAPRDDRYEAERNGPARDGDYAPRDGGYGGDGNQGQDQYRY